MTRTLIKIGGSLLTLPDLGSRIERLIQGQIRSQCVHHLGACPSSRSLTLRACDDMPVALALADATTENLTRPTSDTSASSDKWLEHCPVESPIEHSLNQPKIALLIGGGAAADTVRDWDQRFGLSAEASHQLAIESLSLTASLIARLVPNTIVCRSREAMSRAWSQELVPILDPLSLLAELEASTTERLPASWAVTSDTIAAWLAIHAPFERLVLAKSVPTPADLLNTDSVDDYFRNMIQRLPVIEWVNLRSDETSDL